MARKNVNMTSAKYHRLQRRDDGFVDLQFERPPPKIPVKAIGLATGLFVLGSVLIIIGVMLLTGYIDTQMAAHAEHARFVLIGRTHVTEFVSGNMAMSLRRAVGLYTKVPSLKNAFAAFSTRGHWLCQGSGEQISRYPVPEKESLEADIKQKWDQVEEQGGFVPNVFKILSHHPDEFRAFFQYHDAVMETESGSLKKADKEMIIVATSAENKCLYCVVAHSALHRLYSKNPTLADQIATNWRDADLGPREKAILEFAIEVCHCRPIEESHFENLEQHGLSREDAWYIGAITAFFGLSNRMAGLARMRPNQEFYLLGRVNKELYTKALKN